METSSAFLLVGVVITLAAFLGAWSTFLKQPIFIAYILAGVLAGPLIFRDGSHVAIFDLLRDLGLSFVLFLVGLEIKISDLKDFGRSAILVGLKQVIFVLIVGGLVARVIGFGNVESLYIGVALAFSSTIVAVKLLTEKRDFDSLYGQLTVAILLLQDLLAIFVLILIAGFGKGSVSIGNILLTVLIGSILLGVGYYLNKTLLPYVFDRIARSLELLFVGSLAWLFIVAAVASFTGFSIEIGAFLAGVGLANLPVEHQIAARIRPLRDFFILIFFILIGARIPLADLPKIILPSLLLALLVLVVKPLVTMFLLSQEGFRKRTSFMVGISIAQVSEFSLIILFLGQSVGHLDQQVVGIVATASLISIAVSSYALAQGTKLYRRLSQYLGVFEPQKRIESPGPKEDLENHFVLIGAGRLGWDILKSLRRRDEKVLVVDFNPKVVEELREDGELVLFGDITDPEILAGANLTKAKLVISTVFDPEDTQELLEYTSQLDPGVPVVATAPTESTGLEFYGQGATYVVIPRVISSKFFSNLLGRELDELVKGELRSEQIEILNERLKDRGATPTSF